MLFFNEPETDYFFGHVVPVKLWLHWQVSRCYRLVQRYCITSILVGWNILDSFEPEGRHYFDYDRVVFRS